MSTTILGFVVLVAGTGYVTGAMHDRRNQKWLDDIMMQKGDLEIISHEDMEDAVVLDNRTIDNYIKKCKYKKD